MSKDFSNNPLCMYSLKIKVELTRVVWNPHFYFQIQIHYDWIFPFKSETLSFFNSESNSKIIYFLLSWFNYFNFNYMQWLLCITVPRGSILTEHIIIGTPGKVVDWALKFKFFELNKIRVFVLDEADVMIATQGHQDQSFRIRK